MVLLDGNPLEFIANVRRIAAVFARGDISTVTNSTAYSPV